MAYSVRPPQERVTIHPGGQHATREATIISTLLGSCVAACLYDETAGVAGMNHFLLANRRYSRSMPLSVTDAGRYGIHAMELLINEMLRLGATKRGLRAKVFGGGQIIESAGGDNFTCVGEVNARFMLEFLATEGIGLVSQDLGGDRGRLIHFHTDSFQVFRKYIQRTETVEVESEERGFWSRSIEEHERPDAGVVLFS